MELYHQTGHNECWNIESFVEDGTGTGLILSPVNIKSKKIKILSEDIKNKSILDPQLYLPKECKGKLETYDFFPTNLVKGFKTKDFDDYKENIAEICINFQVENNFRFITIPTRYYEQIPSDYYNQITQYFVEPFLKFYTKENIQKHKEIFLTIIVNESILMNDNNRNELLNWITSFQDIHGIYLIFEKNSQSKQIKNLEYLFNALTTIHTLKSNELKVYIGYSNTEGLLYSIADPDAITMGSYENLRQFGMNTIKRFACLPKKVQNPPTPRLYSRALFQFIDYRWISGIKRFYPEFKNIFEDSKYKPLMFEPDFNWHFMKPEPYKHFFYVYDSQVKDLPDTVKERIEYFKKSFSEAIKIFDELSKNIYFDENSDGSHLNFWLTCINMYEKYLKENNYAI